MHRIVRALLILAAVLLAACGSSEDPGVDPSAARASEVASTPGAAGDIDACALLSEAEAAGFLGAPVTGTEPFKIRTFYACEWSAEAGVVDLVLQVGVFDFSASSAVFTDAASAAGDPEPMSGVGDEAYWTALHELYVRSGDRMFSVIPTTPGDRDQAAEVARLIVPRLP